MLHLPCRHLISGRTLPVAIAPRSGTCRGRGLTAGLLLTGLLASLPAAGPVAAASQGTSAAAEPPPSRTMAVTIDDLPMAGEPSSGDLAAVRRVNDRMLAALGAQRVPAIGFVNESRCHRPGERDARVAVLASWLEAGMDLGNHTYSHPDLQRTPLREYQDDVLHGEVLTRQLLEARGRSPRFFRYPYNHTGPTAEAKEAFREFLAARGYRVAPFTVEHSDYVFSAVYAAALRDGDGERAGRVRKAYREQLDVALDYAEELAQDTFGRPIPQILLIHVNELNAAALADMLARIEARGYGFVPLEEALADPAYRTPDEYVGRWGPSWLHRWRVGLGLPARRDEPDPPSWVIEAYRALRKR